MDQYNKIYKLNQEYVDATSERRREIEQEIIDMVPASSYSGSSTTQELTKLLGSIKTVLSGISTTASKEELKAAEVKITEMGEKINEHALRFGLDLPKTDYAQSIRKLIEERFNET